MTKHVRYGLVTWPESQNYINIPGSILVNPPEDCDDPTVLDIPDGSDGKGTLMAPPAGEEEIIEVHLGIVNYPKAYNAKVEELVEEGAFPTETEARSWLRQTPITLELIYEKGHGLFAVESEAVEGGGIVSPYTGKEIVTPENI